MRGRWGFLGVGITGEGEPERLGPSGAARGRGVSGTECGERRPLAVVPPHGPGAAAVGGRGGAGARGAQGMRRGAGTGCTHPAPARGCIWDLTPPGCGSVQDLTPGCRTRQDWPAGAGTAGPGQDAASLLGSCWGSAVA